MAKIKINLPRRNVRRWHMRLVELLRQDGHCVSIELRQGFSCPPALRLVEIIEDLLYQRPLAAGLNEQLADEVTASEPPADDKPDLLFDLTGSAFIAENALAPLYDLQPGEGARDGALLGGQAPLVTLSVRRDGAFHHYAVARPALEQPHLLRRGQDVIAACLTVLVRGLARQRANAPLADIPTRSAPPISPCRFLLKNLVARARSRLKKLIAHEGHWRIGWRRLDGQPSLFDRPAMPPASAWTWLADDRQRYFADPFLIEEDGVLHVLCEEFPYQTGKGIISAFTIDRSGHPSPPRPVLERPYHLSYPFVFRHDQAIYMVPETSAAGQVELYRAARFPDRWTLEHVLIEARALSDVTLFQAGSHWWMTAASHDLGGSGWDSLAVYQSEDLFGRWRQVGDGPLLIDATCARPAGGIVARADGLWRPAQDCSQGYGAGLTLCRIDELSLDRFSQSVMAKLAPPPHSRFHGTHTLNAAGDFEIIDAVGWQPRRS